MAVSDHHSYGNPAEPNGSRLTSTIPMIGESLLMLGMLLMFSEALLGPLLTDVTRPEDSAVLRIMWFPIYGVIFTLGMTRIVLLANLAIRMPILILLMGFIAASTFWSIDQELTSRRFIAIGMTTTFGLYLASRYDWKDLLTLFGITWLILCVGAFIVSLGVPSLGVDSGVHVGAWKGLWFEKNTMGGHISRASFLFGFLAITQPDRRKVWIAGLLMAVALVLLSQSATSLLGMLLGFLILAAGWIMRRGPIASLSIFWSIVTFGGVFALVILVAPEFFLGLLGKDPTLTGRTDIWEVLLELIKKQPERGYGYGAFWSTGSSPALYVREITQWEVPTAHNGWLEVWLGIGLWGLALFCLSFFLTIVQAIRAMFVGWIGFFALGFIAQFTVFSMSESNILQQNSITWVAYVAVAASLVQDRLGRQPIKLTGVRRNRDFILAD